MSDTRIVIRYRTIDRFSERRVFTTLKGARAYARKRLGDSFDIGTGYAVSGDGIGKVMVEGIGLHELLEQPVDLLAEPELGDCRWFVLCGRTATGTTPHPVLGAVPTCDRCHAFATA